MRAKGFGVAAVVALLFSGAADAQILTENAGVTPPTIPTFRVSFKELLTERLESTRIDYSFIFGITPKLELNLNLPTFVRHRVRDVGTLADAGELGDFSLQIKRSLWQRDGVVESTRWAIFGRVTAPTGKHDREVDGVELERALQPGTGGWGLTGGTALTVIRDRHRLSLDLEYTHRTRHDGVRLGGTVGLDAAYWFRLTPARFSKEAVDEDVEVRAVFELRSLWQEPGRGFGTGDGGLQLWAAPGVQVYATRRVLFEANVLLPLVSDIDDALGRRRLGLSLSLKILF